MARWRVLLPVHNASSAIRCLPHSLVRKVSEVLDQIGSGFLGKGSCRGHPVVSRAQVDKIVCSGENKVGYKLQNSLFI